MQNRKADINLLISYQEMGQLILRKTMWENRILGIKDTSFYELRVKGLLVTHLPFSHIICHKYVHNIIFKY